MIENIETTPIEIQGDNIIMTPQQEPMTISAADYLAQANSRLAMLTESKTSTEAQLASINQAIADIGEKISSLTEEEK